MNSPVKVINLRRSGDRRESFSRNNAHVAHEFFEAVDGKALSDAQIEDPRHFIHPLPFPSLGAYGCALSHLRLWEEAIALDRPVTVSEDDAVFRLDFARESAAVLARLPEDWDFVLWGWNFDSILSLMSTAGFSPAVMVFDQDLLRENMEGFRTSTTPAVPLGLDRCGGIPAYTISPKGARKFRAECFPMKHFEMFFPVLNRNIPNAGIDIAMARTYSVTKSFVAFPPLVATKNEQRLSTIQA
ncbi:glycosyltransferase family 25 protein [Ramlibacter sp. G-1-2-2]|uniref:Glycosyltransferase family 25 protein n=1 Tax=Ramlibacter agri TaxID=2728837 RepID=A0A848H6M6_9BURK|nr:glycosyltransferase family 25 protein [Ramlibacter agri]